MKINIDPITWGIKIELLLNLTKTTNFLFADRFSKKFSLQTAKHFITLRYWEYPDGHFKGYLGHFGGILGSLWET